MTDRRDGFIGIYDAITKHHRVVTIDQRGHGFSGHTPGHYHREDHARDIRFVLEKVCQGPTVVWGHSMGGGNVMELMAEPPGNVKAVVLEEATLFGPRRPATKGPNRSINYFQTVFELLQSGPSEAELLTWYEAKFPGKSESYNRLRVQKISNHSKDLVIKWPRESPQI